MPAVLSSSGTFSLWQVPRRAMRYIYPCVSPFWALTLIEPHLAKPHPSYRSVLSFPVPFEEKMFSLRISFLVLIALIACTHAAVWYRVLDVVPSSGSSSAPAVSFFLDGVKLNTNPVLYGHSTGFGATERILYYPTTAGDHTLLVVNNNNNSIVYVNTTITGFTDGNYYTTLAGNPTLITLQDDPSTSVPAGFAKVRFVNTYSGTGNNSLTLGINGVNNATMYDNTVLDYILLDNTRLYNLTAALTSNLAVPFFKANNQNFTSNSAFTYYLIGALSFGGYYNSSSGYGVADGAAGPTATTAATTVVGTTPAVTTPTTNPSGTTQAGTTPSGTTPAGTTTTKPGSTTTVPATTQSSAAIAAISAAVVLAASVLLLA